jgi:hypothetical protein
MNRKSLKKEGKKIFLIKTLESVAKRQKIHS